MSLHDLKTQVSAKELERARDYFKLPEGVDESIIKMDILAARNQVMAEVGEQIDNFFDDNPIFQAAVLLSAYTMYNNRDKDSQAMIFEHPVYQNFINSMKDTYRLMLAIYGPDINKDYYPVDSEEKSDG